MKKELFEQLKEELKVICMVIIGMVILLKIAFYKEEITATIRMAGSLVWLFLIPGYCILLSWIEEIGLFERLIMGSLIAAGVLGMMSYYVGMLGVHVRLHSVLLPIAFITLGILAMLLKQRIPKEQ